MIGGRRRVPRRNGKSRTQVRNIHDTKRARRLAARARRLAEQEAQAERRRAEGA